MFGPVGKALDDRDELIRAQLAAVGDNSAEVENLIVRRDAMRFDGCEEKYRSNHSARERATARAKAFDDGRSRATSIDREIGLFGVYPNDWIPGARERRSEATSRRATK